MRYLFIIVFLSSTVFTKQAVIAATTQKPDAELRQLLKDAIADADSFEDRFDAEVWLKDMSTRLTKTIKDPAKRINLLKQIHYEAKRVGLAPELILSIIQVESNFDRFAISRVGAIGLMQIMPFWLKEIGRTGDNLFNMRTNLRFGCTILKHYLKKEKGNLTYALARYNGSRNSFVYPKKVYYALDNRWFNR
ncbi:FIG016425: Soluble lytic murein transglycosylase and related regulatory proteins (some contain LysM/invasin domains) [hydrothermal vent metagenome]|uniref:FIG016425: Soluble lytic murein transglycosylase and related regulatory proteins (Some contain LysM/invasin domains) n=1 Tax=hydrothermal vent metagenome TaxID=652676 RepID=A0A3B0ZQK9_9ZZZZ